MKNLDEIKCPKCNSENYDIEDDTSGGQDTEYDVYCRCLDCNTSFVYGVFMMATDDIEIIVEEEKELIG